MCTEDMSDALEILRGENECIESNLSIASEFTKDPAQIRIRLQLALNQAQGLRDSIAKLLEKTED